MKKRKTPHKMPDLREQPRLSGCLAAKCPEPHYSKGLCLAHYRRVQRILSSVRERRTSDDAADVPISAERFLVRVRLPLRKKLEKRARSLGFRSLAGWAGAILEGKAPWP